MSKRPRRGWSKKAKKANTTVNESDQVNGKSSDKSNPHYFRLKGKRAEDVIHQLAEKTFFKDWCFLNPLVKNGKELCDLLVVFEETVIIWQIKDLELQSDGMCNKRELDKNLRQLSGARRQLFDLKSNVTLFDGHGQEEIFNPAIIKNAYLISVLTGPEQGYYSPVEQIKKYTAHVFSGRALEILLKELDTISDFCAYLKAKEEFFALGKSLIIQGGEEDLLGYYLLENRSFGKFSTVNMIYLTGDYWDDYIGRKEVMAKDFENKVSYVWDNLIKEAASTGQNSKHITREMAKLSRFERRAAAKSIIDLAVRASNDKNNNIFRRNFNVRNVSYTLLLIPADWSREARKKILQAQSIITRDMSSNSIVIGFATELGGDIIRSFDFCYLNQPDWKDEDRAHAQALRRDFHLWERPEIYHYHEDEYPQT